MAFLIPALRDGADRAAADAVDALPVRGYTWAEIAAEAGISAEWMQRADDHGEA